jgi:hypothetical protein
MAQPLAAVRDSKQLVFNLDLKTLTVSADLIRNVKLFHILGAATEKVQSQKDSSQAVAATDIERTTEEFAVVCSHQSIHYASRPANDINSPPNFAKEPWYNIV